MKALVLPFRLLAFLLQCARLAMTQIWLHKTKAALTTIGILIGVAATIGVTAGLLGFKTKVLSELEAAGTDAVFLGVRVPETGPKKSKTYYELRWLREHIDGLVENCPSVETLSRQVWIRGGARHGNVRTDEVDIFGVSYEYMDVFDVKIQQGRPITAADEANRRYVCVIDERVIPQLNLNPDAVGEEIVMLGGTLQVVGIAAPLYRGSFVNFDDETPNIYVPLNTVFHDRDYGQLGIALKATSPHSVEEAAAEATFFLRGTRAIGPGEPDDFIVQTVRSVMDVFDSRARTITLVAAAVVGISLVVGGIGIMNIMLVSVTERTREIGLRKAVGASSTAVLFQFLVEAVAVCLLGGVLGVLAGEGLALAIRCLPGGILSMCRVPWWSVTLAFGVTSVVGLFFGMFPAVRAARLNPIEALRHE